MSKLIVVIIVGICLLIDFVTITAASTDYSIESDHPYANNYDHTWPEISQPGAAQIRLHFTKLDLAHDHRDVVTLLDKDGNELVSYDDQHNKEDFWTDWYTGNIIKVKLTTNEEGTAYGFKIDKIDTRKDPAYTPTEKPVLDAATAGTYSASPSGTAPEQPSLGPQASFTSNVGSGYTPLDVVFTDTSTGTPTSWYWDFGDGATSTAQNPMHIYDEAGRYTVKLTVTNDAGSNKVSKDFHVLAVANEQPHTTSTQISEPTPTETPISIVTEKPQTTTTEQPTPTETPVPIVTEKPQNIETSPSAVTLSVQNDDSPSFLDRAPRSILDWIIITIISGILGGIFLHFVTRKK